MFKTVLSWSPSSVHGHPRSDILFLQSAQGVLSLHPQVDFVSCADLPICSAGRAGLKGAKADVTRCCIDLMNTPDWYASVNPASELRSPASAFPRSTNLRL
ncbi:hypothetical protein EI94DRAFT_1758064 [Lactarius quietus]|nr:hypothetical protein EI94DRAFT_1758064 [Lactarius quietus]